MNERESQKYDNNVSAGNCLMSGGNTSECFYEDRTGGICDTDCEIGFDVLTMIVSMCYLIFING